MNTRDDSDYAVSLPPELVSALQVAGFAKVAGRVTGVSGDSEVDLYAKIGTSLFLRRKEAALIRAGLNSLRTLENDR